MLLELQPGSRTGHGTGAGDPTSITFDILIAPIRDTSLR
jgi:hypothetical protein